MSTYLLNEWKKRPGGPQDPSKCNCHHCTLALFFPNTWYYWLLLTELTICLSSCLHAHSRQWSCVVEGEGGDREGVRWLGRPHSYLVRGTNTLTEFTTTSLLPFPTIQWENTLLLAFLLSYCDFPLFLDDDKSFVLALCLMSDLIKGCRLPSCHRTSPWEQRLPRASPCCPPRFQGCLPAYFFFSQLAISLSARHSSTFLIVMSCTEVRLFSYASINMIVLGCVLPGWLQGSSYARPLSWRSLLAHSQRWIRRCGTTGWTGMLIQILNQLINIIQYVNRMIEEALDTYKTAKRNGAAIDTRLEALINRLFERNLNKVR